VPVTALVTSSAGLAVAVLVQWLWRDSAYVWFLGVALFGALLVWTMIFVCHLAFRRKWTRPSAPHLPFRSALGSAGSIVGLLVVVAVLVSTWWTPGLRPTLLAAGPWILIVVIGYRVTQSRRSRVAPSDPRLASATGVVSK
jgi:amino acid transporter, AAT family